MNYDVLMKLMSVLKRAAPHPDRFSASERTAMVDLVMLCSASPNNWVAIRAAEAGIAMEGFNIEAERLAGIASESEPWATHTVPT